MASVAARWMSGSSGSSGALAVPAARAPRWSTSNQAESGQLMVAPAPQQASMAALCANLCVYIYTQ
jgi:hypothetical protein